jgi:hypothetical protein
MEQHPIPQNVTTFQFRLIGDMTIKQFGYLAGGAMIGYIIYRMPFPTFIGLPAGILTFLLGFGFAFVPVEERPMDIWFLSFIKSIYNPTLYVWQREKLNLEPPAIKATTQQAPQKTATQILPLTPATPPIQPTVVASTPRPLQIDTPPIIKPAQSTVAPPIQKQVVPTPINKPVSAPQPPPMPKPTAPVIQKPQPTPAPTPVNPPTIQAPHPNAPVPIVKPPEKPKTKSANLFTQLFGWLFTQKQSTQPKPAPVPPRVQAPSQQAPSELPSGFMPPVTPQIIGNKINMNTDVATAPMTNPQRVVQETVVTETSAEVIKQAEKAEIASHELENKLMTLEAELKQKTASEDRIIELQKQLTELLSERQNMQSELSTLRTKLQNTPLPNTQSKTATIATPTDDRPTVKVITPETAVKSGLPRLTTFPNVVTGIIKDNEGNLLPGVLVTVRDKEDIPVRALKTNKLGQFAASTPLPSSTYIVEVEDPRSRFVFDRIQITLAGGIVPAIEVIAKSIKELSRAKLEKEIFGKQNM